MTNSEVKEFTILKPDGEKFTVGVVEYMPADLAAFQHADGWTCADDGGDEFWLCTSGLIQIYKHAETPNQAWGEWVDLPDWKCIEVEAWNEAREADVPNEDDEYLDSLREKTLDA
jgi:hypothetical protein